MLLYRQKTAHLIPAQGLDGLSYAPGNRRLTVIGEFILLNDFTCRETRLHNADWFIRMITLGSIQRYAV